MLDVKSTVGENSVSSATTQPGWGERTTVGEDEIKRPSKARTHFLILSRITFS